MTIGKLNVKIQSLLKASLNKNFLYLYSTVCCALSSVNI